MADDTEAALRWGAAALERDSSTSAAPAALLVTSRLLERMGRMRAAIDGLRLAVQRAIEARDLPLAVAAVHDLRALGIDATPELDELAGVFGRDSRRLQPGAAPFLHDTADFQPLSPFLTGPSLASKAVQVVQMARRASEEGAGAGDPPLLSPLPLFSALSKEALRDLLGAFEAMTVPAGHRVIEEGQPGDAAYFVARGELEISRRSNEGAGVGKLPVSVTRLGGGAFFGESALLSQLPSPATVTAIRPCILLVARRAALEAVAARHPEAMTELAAHCRRQTVSNLGWTSPVIAAMPPIERAALVERLETRVYARGDRLASSGEDAGGLHLVVSGEVAVVASEGGEPVVLATLGAGETVGEVELVLCRKVAADSIAVRGTATLFLPRDEFLALVQEYPAILYALYAVALRRHNETQLALQAGSAFVADEFLELKDASAAQLPEPKADVGEATKRGGVGKSSDAPSRVTAPLPPPSEHAVDIAVPALPVAPTIILQELRAELGTSSAPPPDTKRSKFPGHSARPDRSVSPSAAAPAPTSLSPMSATLPPAGRLLPSKRPLSPARQTMRAAGLGAVAAGVIAAAELASRDTQWGTTAAAAGAAAREPPTAPPVVTTATAATFDPPAAPPPAAMPSAAASAQRVSRKAGAPPPVPKRSAPPASPPSSASPAASTAPAAPQLAASDVKAPAAAKPVDDDEFGGRK